MMKILDKYLFKNFGKLYFIIFSIFLSIFIVVEFFEKFDKFLGKNAKILDVFFYFVLRIPYIIILCSPIAVILAGLFLMQYLAKHNEITAIRGSGISILRMSLPLFAFGFLLSIAILLLGEFVLPKAETTRENIKDVKIYKHPKSDIRMRSDIHYKDDEGRLYYIRFLDGYRNKIKNIDISEFNEKSEIIRKINSEYAIWKDNADDNLPKDLVFHKCYIREFSNGKLTNFEQFKNKIIPSINIQPVDLVKSTKDPMEMNFFELKKYISRLQRIGEKHQKELVEINLKIAFPFINLIILLFCIPLSTLSIRGKSRGIGFVIGIAICFLYISSTRLGQSLGYNEIISPFFAAWFSNIVFGIVGLCSLLKLGK